jgi:hypothetical protein
MVVFWKFAWWQPTTVVGAGVPIVNAAAGGGAQVELGSHVFETESKVKIPSSSTSGPVPAAAAIFVVSTALVRRG